MTFGEFGRFGGIAIHGRSITELVADYLYHLDNSAFGRHVSNHSSVIFVWNAEKPLAAIDISRTSSRFA